MSQTPRFFALCLAALPLCAATAVAQTPAGTEFAVNTYTSGGQTLPTVAMLRDGAFVIVWQSDGQDGSGSGVFAQRYAGIGVPAGSEFRVNDSVTGVQQAPQVAALPSGGFVVTWSGSGPGDLDEGVFARRYHRTGVPGGPSFLVNTTTTGAQSRSAVAAGGAGGFVVVWTTADGSSTGVFGQRYDASGARAGAEFQVNTYTTDAQDVPQVAMAADGRFAVVWTSPGEAANSLGISGQRFDAAGARAGAEFGLNTNTSSSFGQPRIACDAAGDFTVVWLGADGDFTGIAGRRFDRDGAPLGPEFTVNDGTYGLQYAPQVASDAAGDSTVVWQSHAVIVGSRPIVVARRFDRAGMAREPSFVVSGGLYALRQPAVASDADGNFVVAWTKDPNLGDVVARRFGGLQPAAMVVDGNGVLEAGEEVVVAPAWSNRNGQALTFSGAAAIFTGPGPAGDPSYVILDGAATYGTVANGATGSCAGTPDCYRLSISVPTARPAQHWDATLLEEILPASLGMARLWPLHVGGSFDDVPASSSFYRFVETLLHRSVTAGCGPGTYCPADSTTREQMAVFVLAAREGAGFLPPACTTPAFNDVPASSAFCRWVEELARRGVVAGCGAGSYCPSSAVTREQMAVFVLRTLDPTLDPPACATPVFADVPATSPFCRWIEELFRRRVVSGCGGGNYCPGMPVTREQMSVFLGVTFNLTLYGP